MEEIVTGFFNLIFANEVLSIKYILPLALVIGGVYGYADSADGTVRKLSLGLAGIGGIGFVLVLLGVIG